MKVLFLFFISLLTIGICHAAGPETDKIVETIINAYSKVNDYTCSMSKKELVDGKYIEQKNILYKHKKPNKYYMKWTEGSDKGQEAIYAGKKYGNKLYVHPGGTFSFISTKIDPKGGMAMKDNRHSILESDYGYIVSLIKTNFNKAKTANEGKFKIDECTNPEGITITAEFPEGKDYYCGKIIIFLDKKLNLPTQFKVFDWKGKLLESYKYINLKVNTGLSDNDFDVDNSDYDF
jgi:outer membrane lipoprotein-sorting protein